MHVYCTNCQNGEELFKRLNDDEFVEPKVCDGCCSWNPEDSMHIDERPNYKPI